MKKTLAILLVIAALAVIGNYYYQNKVKNRNVKSAPQQPATGKTNFQDAQEEMIPHHQMAVMMAQMLKNSTQRPEMRNIADNIINTQTKEIDQMRNWYSQWYQ